MPIQTWKKPNQKRKEKKILFYFGLFVCFFLHSIEKGE